MAKNGQPKSQSPSPSVDGITRVTVCGFKSLAQEQSIEIRPLTILAGANSSGKSSIIQPLLLLKQTLEASYDPGALLLDGANLKFTSADQVFTRRGGSRGNDAFHVGLRIDDRAEIATFFKRRPTAGIDVARSIYKGANSQIDINLHMTNEEIERLFESESDANFIKFIKTYTKSISRERCFLHIAIRSDDNMGRHIPFDLSMIRILGGSQAVLNFENYIISIIHLPGLRGNPSRTYPVTAVGPHYPGTFETYTASVISRWEEEKKSNEIERLSNDLKSLGLTWKVTAKRINDTQVELQVGRLPRPLRENSRDLVSIADVGFGVSQVLPVLVALHAASPGQLVYLEQPEIHLHPRAQLAMAKVLANAAKRGVRVVVETHSDLLLLGIHTEVAKGHLPPDLVKLHWFQRKKDGTTQITSADLDGAGTVGSWPEDFDDVRLDAQSEFLDASLDFKESR